MTTVLVFGSFDGLHPGHAHMLAEAKSLGDRLVVCLATDATIARLKGHAPRHPFEERKVVLELLPVIDVLVAGDDVDGTYSVITEERPDIIAFGYDQQSLHDDCVAWLDQHGIVAHTVFLQPHEPQKFKSSLLNT